MSTTFVTADPAWEARVRDSFSRQRFMSYLGALLTELVPGRAAIELPYRPELTQQHGYFHAGAAATIADSAGGYAAYSLFPPNSSVLSVEFKINLLAPARGERLRALAEVVRCGRTLTVCRFEVQAFDGGAAASCAIGQQTLICLRDRADG